MKFKPTIGLEIHIELNTKSKMFCACENDPLEYRPNINICPICMGHPGTLPVINEKAVEKVIKTGLALNSDIPENSKFDRKNYFYPDLPKGYQISQYDQPLCIGGFLETPIFSSGELTPDEKKVVLEGDFKEIEKLTQKKKRKGKKIRITRVHLEEDTGRLLHSEKDEGTLVDFNRAGVPLMELVTEPDIASGEEAREFAEELQLILRYIKVSDADMEKGQMRVEVNISLSPDRKLGTKVEIKNLNSLRVVEDSIDFEIERQTKLLEEGQKIIQETRGWDGIHKKTVSQREKEEAHDYRYFPEPDLPPLQITKEKVKKIKAEIEELPQAREQRLIKEYWLEEKNAEIFVINKSLGEYFEKVISELEPRLTEDDLKKLIKLSANYLISDLLGLLKGSSIEDGKFLITPENFAEFIALINQGKISSKTAK
ncbi:MAG: Asp-tRNA(Asn)/Glu-tRNA(Gln) amidotransferase subunit GatB, partial [Candidatus Parcubacteria bacterium]|nr:Asp-tRNA(Asn)/Glu-tRNA(Gln) amidotransferase subunit GatB [Candidatus Parcubacteria bacterium]